MDMKKLDTLLKLLKEYELPYGGYAVFGSAPLVIVGMVNDVNDLDVIIKPKYWEFGHGGKHLTEGIEFFNEWPGFDVDDLIDNHSFEYNGVLFINPNKVIEYKKNMGRDKDRDIWYGF